MEKTEKVDKRIEGILIEQKMFRDKMKLLRKNEKNQHSVLRPNFKEILNQKENLFELEVKGVKRLIKDMEEEARKEAEKSEYGKRENKGKIENLNNRVYDYHSNWESKIRRFEGTEFE